MAEKAKVIKRQLKNEKLATALSLLWPGFGQLYLNKMKKGLLLLIVQAILAVMIFALYTPDLFSKRIICCACGVVPAALCVWLLGMYDAYLSVKKMNKGEKCKVLFD